MTPAFDTHWNDDKQRWEAWHNGNLYALTTTWEQLAQTMGQRTCT